MEQTLFPNNAIKHNFPSKNDLITILYNTNFNKLLNKIKDDILAANELSNNINNIAFYNNTLTLYSNNLILDVKEHLKNLNYKINDIENADHVIIGWRVYW